MSIMSGMGIFVEHPALACAVGAVFLGLGVRGGRRTAIGAGAVWVLYALYETGMKHRWLCSGECDIRVDLLAIYPALLIAAFVGVVSLLRRARSSHS